MTTHNIPQLPQIRGQLRTTAGHVRDRSRKVREELAELDSAETDVRVGAAAVLQSIDDERAENLEEAEQLAAILRQASAVPAVDVARSAADPSPGVTVFAPDLDEQTDNGETDEDFLDELYTRSQLTGMTNARLSQIANSYGMDAPVNDHFDRVHTISRILEAQRRWCIENDEDDPNWSSTQPVAILRDRVQSSWQAVVAAIVAALVTLVVMSRNQETILGWAAGDQGWQDNGLVKFVFIMGPVLAVGWWAFIVADQNFNREDNS